MLVFHWIKVGDRLKPGINFKGEMFGGWPYDFGVALATRNHHFKARVRFVRFGVFFSHSDRRVHHINMLRDALSAMLAGRSSARDYAEWAMEETRC